MTGLALLQSVSAMQHRLDVLDREYDRTCIEVTKATTDLTRPMVQAEGQTDRRYDRLIQLGIKRDKAWDDLICRREICLKLIGMMSEPSWAYVLERWYLDDDKKKLEDVADEVPVSRTQAYVWLRNAEQEFEHLFQSVSDPDVACLRKPKDRTKPDGTGRNRTEPDGTGRDLSFQA